MQSLLPQYTLVLFLSSNLNKCSQLCSVKFSFYIMIYINKSLVSIYIWMLSKCVAIPGGQRNTPKGEFVTERHMSTTPASFLHKIMWVQRNTRLEKAHKVDAVERIYTVILIVTEVCSQLRGKGRAAAVCILHQCGQIRAVLGEAVWDLRWSDTNFNPKGGTIVILETLSDMWM